jgi:hypothetical protein
MKNRIAEPCSSGITFYRYSAFAIFMLVHGLGTVWSSRAGTIVIIPLWWRTICSYCVSRLDRHVTYYTSHMLYICRYAVSPHRSKTPPTGPQLSGANRRAIPCWGTVRRRLSFGLRTFFVTFLLAARYRPILGLDFLSAHGLLVNPVGRQVLDSKTLKPLSIHRPLPGH